MKSLIYLGIFIGIFGSLSGYFLYLAFNESKKNETHEIRTCQDLQDMNKDLDGIYILMNDIDCKEYLNGN